jgi:glycopeptide antibiotics resistance protein
MAVFGGGFGVIALLLCFVWKLSRGKTIFITLLAIYIGALLAFTFFHGTLQERACNLIPFVSLFRSKTKSRYLLQMMVNIAMFTPFGVMLEISGADVKKSVLTGFILSLGIEVFQFILMRGVCDIDDLIMNTIGTLIGLFLTTVIKRLRKRTG